MLEEEWAPYRVRDRHLLFSVSKSFTSMGIGLLVEQGLLSVRGRRDGDAFELDVRFNVAFGPQEITLRSL